jgi:hypothetical protein
MDASTVSELQLQLWDAKTKRYIIASCKKRGKAWRLCIDPLLE